MNVQIPAVVKVGIADVQLVKTRTAFGHPDLVLV